jgi:hypothetical protein
MKKLSLFANSTEVRKLALSSETVRILTRRDLTLIAVGYCEGASHITQKTGETEQCYLSPC